MAKALKTVAMVAGLVAAVAAAPFTGGASIAGYAALVSAAASIGAMLLQKKPPVLGNTSQIQIGANLPMPYVLGQTYVGGALVHDIGYGATLNDVPNPYRSMVIIGSQGGPIDSIVSFQADFTTISFSGAAATGYYAGFLWRSTQLGATPESAALAGPHGAIPQWGSAYKLSGYAAWLITMKHDRKGKVFASGVPQFGVILKGAKTYDPRLDDTYPGGAGDHRFDDEDTFEWSENPGLHGPTYARGRFQGGVKVIGCGFAEDAIDWPAWVAFANVCDANAWVVGGTIFEQPGQSKWDNLKRICQAGGAEPCFVGGQLSVRYPSPKTALDTITAADLADGEASVPAMKGWKDRKNGIIPRYRSEDHKWEYVQSDLVTVSGYVTEDGEEKNEERQYELVQDKDQAAQLAAYDLTNAREFGPIVLPCKPRLIEYKPGEALDVDIPELGLNEQLCVIRGRSIDPGTGIVTLSLESETTAKHAYALGLSGTAPPTPTITTGEEMDTIAIGTRHNQTEIQLLIQQSGMIGGDTAGIDNAGAGRITITAHTRTYADKDVSVNSGQLDGLTLSTGGSTVLYGVYYDDESRAGGAVTYAATTTLANAVNTPTNPFRHFVSLVEMPLAGGGATGGTGSSPGGGAPITPGGNFPEY